MTEISKLISLLREEQEIYKEILDLANEKTDMIAQEDLDQIEDLVKREEEKITQAKLLEYKREDQITAIEKSLGIEKIRDISSLLNHIDSENIRQELVETQTDFANTLEQLKRVNMINNTLTQDALEYIALSLNLMSGATAEGTYGKKAGDMEPQTQNRSMFDFKG